MEGMARVAADSQRGWISAVLGGLGAGTYQVWVVRKGGEWDAPPGPHGGRGNLVPALIPPGAHLSRRSQPQSQPRNAELATGLRKGPQSAQRPPESDCFHPSSTLCQEPPEQAQQFLCDLKWTR